MKAPCGQLRVLIADDHAAFRDELRALLGREGFLVVGSVPDGEQAVRQAGELRPDVALLDLAMPGLNGLDVAQALRKVSPQTKSILLTSRSEVCCVLASFRAGITGYVLKSRIPDGLVRAIQSVSAGTPFLSEELHAPVLYALLADGRRGA